ncbi:MAG TPA: PAS domain S-box protein [Acetobacteraceae bacterium]
MAGPNVHESRPLLDIAAAAFQVLPAPSVLLAPDAPRFTILDANAAYLSKLGVRRENLLGLGLFQASLDGPGHAGTDGERSFRASLAAVLQSRSPDRLVAQLYPTQGGDGGFTDRWWQIVNTPIPAGDITIAAILSTVEEVTAPAKQWSRAAYASQADAGLQRNVELKPEVSWTADAAGCVTGFSPLWTELRGRAPDEPGDGDWARVANPAAPSAVAAGWTQSVGTGVFRGVKHRIRLRDGPYHWTHSRAFSWCGRDTGAVLPWNSVPEDVNDRRQAEGRRRESDARLAWLLDTTPVGVVELDAEGRVTYANAAAERIVGTPPGGMTGLRHDSDRWQIAAADGSPIPADRLPGAWALRGERVTDYEHAFTALDGRHVVALVDIVPVRDEAGGITGALAAFQDVTARHAAAEALRESELRFRGFVENSTDVLWIVDAGTGQLEYLSPAYEGIWGEPRDRIMADLAHWAETVHPDDRVEGVTVLPRVLAGETFTIEYRVVRRDGGVRWIRDTGFPIPEADGRIRRAGGIAQDITSQKEVQAALQRANETLEARVSERTAALRQALDALQAEVRERERAEAALRQSQKMEAVGQLTGGIAHDFNNMLQAISGGLEMMRRRVEQGRAGEAVPLLDAARRTVDRAAALTNRLLAFARRQALQPEQVEPDTLINGMAELIRHTVGPSVIVELLLRDGVWSVLCDPNQLENVLLNLAINARDAMAQPSPGGSAHGAGARPDGGTLTIATADVRLSALDMVTLEGAQPGEYVEIRVADNGAGMDEATRLRAFEPFFTTKPIGQGTGLGLSQLYGFVRQSGGAVQLDSAPGQGTTMRLYLPRHAPVQPGQVGVARVAQPHGAEAGQTVLLVEDEPEVRAFAAEHLRELGYDVLEAEDGPAALRLLRIVPQLDVLVTDVGLPGGMNGRQVADAVREVLPDVPVLFTTGYAGDALADCLAPGMEVIGKPFALDALAARVRRMADGLPSAE